MFILISLSIIRLTYVPHLKVSLTMFSFSVFVTMLRPKSHAWWITFIISPNWAERKEGIHPMWSHPWQHQKTPVSLWVRLLTRALLKFVLLPPSMPVPLQLWEAPMALKARGQLFSFVMPTITRRTDLVQCWSNEGNQCQFCYAVRLSLPCSSPHF